MTNAEKMHEMLIKDPALKQKVDDEIKRIAKLERRMDSAEGDIKQIKGGVSYLVQQLSAPQEPPRRRIGFSRDDDTPSKPYGRA